MLSLFRDLRILTRKKYPQKKNSNAFQKVWIWTFRRLVHQLNSLYEVLNMKQNSGKNIVVTGKTPLFEIAPFCTPSSICLKTCFWQSSFVWKCCLFNHSAFNQKTELQFFEKSLRFSENFFQSCSTENVQNFHWLSHKSMAISQTEGFFKNA